MLTRLIRDLQAPPSALTPRPWRRLLPLPEKLLAGRSARVVVTMGMPAFFYKLVYGAHSVKSLERNILKFVGIRPVGRTIVGAVEADADRRREWLEEIEALGAAGE